MPDFTGTNGNDIFSFSGTTEQLSFTMINPYSGVALEIDDEKNANNATYEGLAGIDILLLSNTGDALFLENRNSGVQMVFNIERVLAGDGDDIVNLASTVYTLGALIIDGGNGDDIIWANVGDDTVNGRGGNDIIDGGPGNDVLNGGTGNGIGDTGNDTISGGAGADLLRGEDGDDTLHYFADSVWGADTSYDGANRTHDTFDGGSGHDTLIMTDGDDVLLLYDADAPHNLSASALRVIGVEEVYAGDGDDVVDFSSDVYSYGDVTIHGGAGDDRVLSGAGNDILYGDAGSDVLNGGDGADTLYGGADDDVLYGAAGADTLYGGAGSDLLEGGSGDDVFHFESDGTFSAGFYAYNIGSPGVMGTKELVSINGKNLSLDQFNGGEGYDTIVMTDGDDAIFLRDTYHEGAAHNGGAHIAGIEQINAGAGNDVVDLTDPDLAYGDIVINGGDGDDRLWSSSGNDTLSGDDGNDSLYGGVGNDTLYGGNGNDRIVGGPNAQSGALITTVTSHNFTNNVSFPNLAETVNIMDLVPDGANALGVAKGDLSVDFDTTIDITFVKTEAGYDNSLGFYKIGADGTIGDVEFAFPNVKDYSAGDTVSFDVAGNPGGSFGFFMIANGGNKNNDYDKMDLENGTLNFYYHYKKADQRLAKITDDAKDIDLVFNDGVKEKVVVGSNNHTYHTTERDGSTDLNADGEVHVVSGVINTGLGDVLRIGFEDLPNLGDADYNDVVFDVSVHNKTTQTLTIDDNDILYGGAGNDIVDGGVGNDFLYGGSGSDLLTGGQGADTFVFEDLDAADTVTDFNAAEGDALDISNLLHGYDPLQGAIDDFVRLTQQGGDTALRVNSDGLGDDFVTVAVLQGGIGESAEELLDGGNLIA